MGLVLGTAADAVFGDPRRSHPVAWFGRLAAVAERACYAEHRWAGVGYTGVLVGAVAGVGLFLERVTRRRPVVHAVITALVTWTVLGARSLAEQGTAMARALHAGQLGTARALLPNLCGRDPQCLDLGGLTRASVESVAENTCDAVVAPLLWGALAGIPGLLGYRAVNTLDAMVGYRSPRYQHFGWAAARLDDLINLLPSRTTAGLAVLCAPLVGGSPWSAWRCWRADAAAHPSPNAGQVEAAFAGALGVRLGGTTTYSHGVEPRPVLGHGQLPTVADLHRAVALSRVITATAAGLGAALATAAQRAGRSPTAATGGSRGRSAATSYSSSSRRPAVASRQAK
jgi:adenosylcobinamide-phosphate synthase